VTGTRKVLVTGGADARYVPAGHLVYVREGAWMAVPFNVARLEVTGAAVGLIANVMQAANIVGDPFNTGAAQFSVSSSGSLVYVPGTMFPDALRSLVWVDRSGQVEPIAAPPRAYAGPRLSPDGQRIAVSTLGTDSNVWIYDLTRGTLTRLTTEGGGGGNAWTPDGQRVAFATAATGHENLFWKPVDGSGPSERLTSSEFMQLPAAWSPDGHELVFVQLFGGGDGTRMDTWVLSMGDRRARPLMLTPSHRPARSPDGRWLAYASEESGRYDVYVQPYPGPGPRTQISTEGGSQPAWSADGRELFYTASGKPGEPLSK
jgi:dipeptidyl aminopeptidase/acylaminoacyl peptidase